MSENETVLLAFVLVITISFILGAGAVLLLNYVANLRREKNLEVIRGKIDGCKESLSGTFWPLWQEYEKNFRDLPFPVRVRNLDTDFLRNQMIIMEVEALIEIIRKGKGRFNHLNRLRDIFRWADVGANGCDLGLEIRSAVSQDASAWNNGQSLKSFIETKFEECARELIALVNENELYLATEVWVRNAYLQKRNETENLLGLIAQTAEALALGKNGGSAQVAEKVRDILGRREGHDIPPLIVAMATAFNLDLPFDFTQPIESLPDPPSEVIVPEDSAPA
ncbi:MAG: hypothetical protein WC385_01925 [Candidatus Paceibacterota bacterium]|jgi:hypothetical protein